MKKRNNSFFRKLLFVSSFSLWAVVFLVSFFILRTDGHLLPLAANIDEPSAKFTIEGKINSSNGLGIASARVIIFENGLKHTYISDSKGHYIIYDLAGGSYKINIEASGFKGFFGGIFVGGQNNLIHNFVLSK